jgi:hypothetical protein
MTETLIYVGLYFILSLVSALLLFLMVASVVLLFTLLLKVMSEKTADKILGLSMVLCPLIVSALPYYSLATIWKYHPPYPRVDLQRQADDTQRELNLLEEQATKLRDSFNDPKNLTLDDTKRLLTRTLDFAEVIKTKMEQQKQLIAGLRQEVTNERVKAEEARKQKENLESLSQEQRDVLTSAITNFAKEESQRSFLLGILVSFPVGIISSLLASGIYRKFGGKARAVLKAGINP